MDTRPMPSSSGSPISSGLGSLMPAGDVGDRVPALVMWKRDPGRSSGGLGSRIDRRLVSVKVNGCGFC
jgi:hypothetical protein